MMHEKSSLLPAYLTRLAIAGCVALVVGCTKSAPGPDTHPVSGKVTYKGEPAAGVTLTFHATGQGQTSQAFTDETGEFVASTNYDMGKSSKPGMIADEYRVTAVKLDRASIKTTLAAPKELLPKKYGSADDSGLTATVVAGEENRFDFDLN